MWHSPLLDFFRRRKIRSLERHLARVHAECNTWTKAAALTKSVGGSVIEEIARLSGKIAATKQHIEQLKKKLYVRE